MSDLQGSILQLLEPLSADWRWFPLLNLLHELTGVEWFTLHRLVERAGYPLDKTDPEALAWAERRFAWWREHYRVPWGDESGEVR
jgi:hypothetical protein